MAINKDKILEIITNSKNVEKMYENYILTLPAKEGKSASVMTITPAFKTKEGGSQLEKILKDLNSTSFNSKGAILTLEGFNFDYFEHNLSFASRDQTLWPFLIRIDGVPVALTNFDIDLEKLLELRLKEIKEKKILKLLEDNDLLVEKNGAN